MNNVFRGMVGYLFLVLAVRFAGKRLGAQITPFDTVIIFFLGGTVLAPVLGDERSITSAMLTAAGVALMFVLIGWLKQVSQSWADFFDGTPLVVREAGNWNEEVLMKMGLSPPDVIAAGRAAGLKTVDQIEYAILERNGQISVIPMRESGKNAEQDNR